MLKAILRAVPSTVLVLAFVPLLELTSSPSGASSSVRADGRSTVPANGGSCDKVPNLLTNGDFDTGAFAPWVGNDVDLTNDWPGQSDGWSVDLNGNDPGTIYQTVADTAGTKYKFCFWLAGNPDGGPTVKKMHLFWTPGGATSACTGVPTTYTFNITGKSRANMGWVKKTKVLKGTGTDTLCFAGVSQGAYGAVIDTVRIW